MVVLGGWAFRMSEEPLYPPMAPTSAEAGLSPYPLSGE
eukprot:CAMPEP_0180152684 /NCGR_PEP_ID=MMETSP0986-20121125/22965_1 /TAXON_ID=697907 /ORGANISM="non described non described, Strain CCMP2293" /LENGTH=37 /DNA_ID= /DNA_START= /DNA_END= /DNA_ORIENTATION=